MRGGVGGWRRGGGIEGGCREWGSNEVGRGFRVVGERRGGRTEARRRGRGWYGEWRIWRDFDGEADN